MKTFKHLLLCLALLSTVHCGQGDSVSGLDPQFDVTGDGAGELFLGRWQLDATITEASCGKGLEGASGQLIFDGLSEENDLFKGNCHAALKDWPETWPLEWPDNWPSNWNQEWPNDVDEMSCQINETQAAVVFYSRESHGNCHITEMTEIYLTLNTDAVPSQVTGTLKRTVSPGNTCPSNIYRRCELTAEVTGLSSDSL